MNQNVTNAKRVNLSILNLSGYSASEGGMQDVGAALERLAILEAESMQNRLEAQEWVAVETERSNVSEETVRFGASRLEAGRSVWDVYLGREKFTASKDDFYPEVLSAFTLNVSTFPRRVKAAQHKREAFEALREAFGREGSWAERGLKLAAEAKVRGAKVVVECGDSASEAAVQAVEEAVRRMAAKLPNPWLAVNEPDVGSIEVVANGGVSAHVEEADWREAVAARAASEAVEEGERGGYAPRANGWGTLYIDGFATERVRVYGTR